MGVYNNGCYLVAFPRISIGEEHEEYMRATDEQLVQQACSGDHRAFGELVDRYRDMVYGLGYHLTGDFEAARDLAQEAFVQAYLNLRQLREPAKFSGWLRRIATNAHRMQRRRHEVPTVALDSEAIAARPDPRPSEIEVVVREALSKLREPERLALTLHYINGYSHAEIGGFLGVRPETVKTRLARARQHLRKEVMAMVEDAFEGKRLPEQFTEETVEAAIARADEHLEHGRVTPAIHEYERALERARDHVPALVGLGRAYQAAGEDDEAVRRLRRVVELDPTNQQAFGWLTQILGQHRQRWAELAALYEQRLRLQPENAAYWHTCLGDLYVAMRRYDDAERHLQRALAMDAENVDAQLALGGLLGLQGRYKEAVVLLKAAQSRLASQDWDRFGAAYEWSQYELAQVYAAAGEYNNAIEAARAVLLEHRPSHCDRIVERSLWVMEKCCHGRGRIEGFPALCRATRKRMPDRRRADRLSWYLALFLESRLRRRQAIEEFERLGAIPARCWRVAVPFDNTSGRGMATAYPPEADFGRDGGYVAGDAPGVPWRKPISEGAEFEINLLTQINMLMPIDEWGIGYCLLRIISTKAREVVFRFGSSGWTQVWLNGESLFLDRSYVGVPDGESVQLRLRHGQNHLLVKVGVQERMASVRSYFYYWSLFSRITDADGEPVRDLRFPFGDSGAEAAHERNIAA
jgi:RNA polymerase sigma-70 factor (ECF subfamily)